MFTGLVEEIGEVVALRPTDRGARLEIRAREVLEGLALGDSVAVNGACLTAVEIGADGFAADCMAETLRRTALGRLRPGDRVHLERALRLGDRLDGHLVQGHVDGVGEVVGAREEGDSLVLDLEAPPELLRFVVEKGSIAIDGVSLTVAARGGDGFSVALIPHTRRVTTLGREPLGRAVNLEVDVLAKYVVALAAPYAPAPGGY